MATFKAAKIAPLSKAAVNASDEERAALMGSPTQSVGVKNLMTAGIPPKTPIKMADGGLVKDSRGQLVDMSRPELQNEDGTFSTGETITVTDPRINDGRPTNIPSIWGGKRPPSNDNAVVENYAISNAIKSGQTFPSYNSIDEAVRAAQQRSNELESIRHAVKPKMANGGLMAVQDDGEMEDVPPGALPEEVRDDKDVRLSEGEVVIPADVVRWVGLEKLEKMRLAAKQGLMSMAQEGRIATGEGGEEGSDYEQSDIPKMAEGGLVGDSYTAAYNAANPSTPVNAIVDSSGRKGYQYGGKQAPTVTAPTYTPKPTTTTPLPTGSGSGTGSTVSTPGLGSQLANVAGGAASIVGTQVATGIAKDVIGGQTFGQALEGNVVQPITSLFGAGGMNGGSAAAAAGAPGQLTAPGALSPAQVTTSELGSSAAGQGASQGASQAGSFSQGLGGAASGAFVGWAAGKLTGGNTTASTIAGAASGLITSGALGFGSTAGLTGSLWGTGAIGGPAGLAIAAAASIIAGQLFKVKPSNKAAEAQITFDANGPATVIGDPQKASKRDPENMSIRDGYVHIASEFGTMLQKAGATAVPNVQLNIGSRDGWQMSVGYGGGHSENYEFVMKQNSADLAATMVMDMVKDSRGISEDLKSRFTDMTLVKYAMSKDDFSPLFNTQYDLKTIYDSEDFKKFANSQTVGT